MHYNWCRRYDYRSYRGNLKTLTVFLVRDVLSWGWRKAIQVHTYSKFTQILDTHDQLIAE